MYGSAKRGDQLILFQEHRKRRQSLREGSIPEHIYLQHITEHVITHSIRCRAFKMDGSPHKAKVIKLYQIRDL